LYASWSLTMANNSLQLRLTMQANGYQPLPAHGKKVLLGKWTTKFDVPQSEITSWSTDHPQWANTGNLARDTPGLDLDIKHTEAAAAAEEVVRDWCDGRGETLIRFGAAPKRLILFQTSQPFGKIRVGFVAPDGGNHAIEMLGDGQQYIVAGIHPDIKRPYSWHADRAPWTVSRSELPEIDAAEARALIEKIAETLQEQFGFQPVQFNGGDHTREPIDIEARLAAMKFEGAGDTAVHTTQLHCTASLLRSGMALTETVALVLEATQRTIAENWDWAEEQYNIEEMCFGHINKNPELVYLLPDDLLAAWQSVDNPKIAHSPHVGWRVRGKAKKSETKSTAKAVLVINESNPTATAKELAVLIAEQTNFLFNGYAPVRIAVEENCLPRALEVTTEAVRVLAHEVCIPVKLRKGKRVAVPLSKDIALLYLNGLEGQWDLRHFRGITTAPILKCDGSIRSADGYDAETRLWCHNIPKLTVAARPTKFDALAALNRLRFFFRTFPFADAKQIHDATLTVDITDANQTPKLDESSFLTALLTAACRQSLDLAPSCLVRAPTFSGSGTGKGLAVKALCIIGSGVRPSAFTSGHDDEEFDKRLTAALVEAHPAIFLDNFNAKELKSDVLASALTEDPAMVRPMGHTKMVPLHTHTFIGITGNAIEIAEDMARRTIITNFDAKMEDPETRHFAPGFLDRVFAARAELLADALTVWRWGRQNKLRPGKPLGNYERWAQWCRDPLLALGTRDPVERLAEIKATDPKRRALITVFDAWWAKHSDATLKASDLTFEVIEHIDQKAFHRADGSLQFNRQRVARFLAIHAGTRVGGYSLEQTKADDRTRPIAKYKLSKHEKST
jgi:hypothetical protein